MDLALVAGFIHSFITFWVLFADLPYKRDVWYPLVEGVV